MSDTVKTADALAKTPLRINPPAFVGALVLAPLVLGAPAFALIWLAGQLKIEAPALLIILIIPVAAVILGALPYLLFGAPALVMALRLDRSIPGTAFLANLAATPAVFASFLIVEDLDDALAAAGMVLVFGSVAAPIWGAFFGWLYGIFNRGKAHV